MYILYVRRVIKAKDKQFKKKKKINSYQFVMFYFKIGAPYLNILLHLIDDVFHSIVGLL